jgi:DNA mismatch repair protein MutL
VGRIHLLDDAVVNKIAAGEVVERPASVVKELVENALDAGATRVEVHLELGGARSIAVTDDGCGMDEADARAALQRHATSKIRSADDLFNIATMGFRGEALAAIGSVSRLTLSTRQPDAACGVRVTGATDDAGAEPLVVPWQGPVGTTVLVENLFYNTPVRAKFLKAPATEFSHCQELIQALALCHPHVAFVLKHNGREALSLPAATPGKAPWRGEEALRERARAVAGKDAAQLVYVTAQSRFGTVEALVSPPGLERASGKHMWAFVNGRWVKDKVVRYGILRGYHTHLLKGRFPVGILHFTSDPALVDVNVHPAKTELRFQYPGEVQNLIAMAIRDRLRTGDWAAAPLGAFDAPGVEVTNAGTFSVPRDMGRDTRASGSAIFAGAASAAPSAPKSYGSTTRRSFAGGGSRETLPLSAVTDQASLERLLGSVMTPATDIPLPFVAPAIDVNALDWDALEYVGTFARCFMLFQDDDRLIVVDQHAFHERILFERLVRDPSLSLGMQPLLVPEGVELAPTDVARLVSRRAELMQRGFDFSVEGATTVEVRGVPTLLAGRGVTDLFADLARDGHGDGDEHAEPNDSNTEMGRLVLATMACHAAVRAGEDLTDNDRRQLLAEAKRVDFFHNCPHGRRVLRAFSKRDVSHWFDR